MPFGTGLAFKGYYDPGDLIYGLATTRSKLVMHFTLAITANNNPIVTVDQYRTRSLEERFAEERASTDRNQKRILAERTKQERIAWNHFLTTNEKHPRYGRFSRAIRGTQNDEHRFAETHPSAALQNSAWRAKSKFGMEWTLSGQRGHIHFVLDDIDMGAVVTKTHQFADSSGQVRAQDSPRGKAPDGADKERTITHSELRWIYRNRGNPLVSGGVQFWLSTGATINACGAPWNNATERVTMPSGSVLTWQQAWTVYHPVHERNTF